MYAVMNPVVYLWLHKSLKNIQNFSLLIHFNRTDLDDLKRQTTIGIFFSTGTLIPFQVKNNIIHTVFPSFCFSCDSCLPFTLLSSITDRPCSFNKSSKRPGYCSQKKTGTILCTGLSCLYNYIFTEKTSAINLDKYCLVKESEELFINISICLLIFKILQQTVCTFISLILGIFSLFIIFGCIF